MTGEDLNQTMVDATASDGWLMHKSTTLAALRAYYEVGGHIVALQDALILCKRHSFSNEQGGAKYSDGIPDWILDGCQKIVADRIENCFTVGKGQLGNEKAISNKSKQHLIRYLEVESVRSNLLIKGKKPSFNKAYKKALENLKGTIAGNVTWHAVRDSHTMVSKEIKSKPANLKYYPFK